MQARRGPAGRAGSARPRPPGTGSGDGPGRGSASSRREVALGASTIRAAHTAIGRTIDLVLDQAGGHPKPVRMRVVGTVIVPPTPYLATGLGQGAVLALEGYLRIDPGAARQRGGLPFLVRFAPGVSRDAGLAAVAKDIKSLPNPFVFGAERPANVLSLASIAGLPAALSGLLALMAAGFRAAGPDGRRDAGSTLGSSTRRRRRDLAILKSLGFIRRQVRHAIAWQATTIAGIALLIGIAGGRWAWRAFATQLGVLPEPAVPLITIFIAIPSALALANLIAAPRDGRQRAPSPPPYSGASKKQTRPLSD